MVLAASYPFEGGGRPTASADGSSGTISADDFSGFYEADQGSEAGRPRARGGLPLQHLPVHAGGHPQPRLTPPVDARLRALEAFGVELLDGICGTRDQRVGVVVRREVGEDVVGERPRVAPLRTSDADAEVHEVRRLQVLRDRAQAVVAGQAAAELQLEAAEIEVALVVDDEH